MTNDQRLNEYIIMPNHIRMIIHIDVGAIHESPDINERAHHDVPLPTRFIQKGDT
ncbi:MAG: hypothetical protein XD98_0303, partial [Microgenomates bacterium 39_6]